ncbi:hypothetical protein KVV02_002807 [Mortierella alpina]|uniref:Peroxisomal ATPase PEX1 n=1 Tax=Mortierella alpina TaxID=64518 RepID=A0A9P7ZXU2_MORAP|nr:hypothetical protein KVV02_002807 [Mortierella alpina]
MQKSVTVAFLPLRHCLISLPAAWANALLDQGKLSQNVVLELSWQDGAANKRSYVGWSGSASSGADGAGSGVPRPGAPSGDTIEMDPQFGQAMGLRVGQKVNIDFVKSVQDGISVNVAPYSEDDWEILELHAGYVEDQMLNQIRILYPNQVVTMWVNGRTLVRLRVLDINPNAPCVKLGANAEVIVAPMVRKVHGSRPTTLDNQDLSTHVQKLAQAQCLRVLALDEISDDLRESLPDHGPFTVQVHPDSWIEADLVSKAVLRMTKVVPPHAEKATDDETRDPEDLLVGSSAVYVKAISSHSVPIGHVAISKQVQYALDAENFSIVRLSETQTTPVQLPSVTLHPITASGSSPATPTPLKLQPKSTSHDSDKAAKAAASISIFKEWIASLPEHDTVVLSHGSLVVIPHGDSVQSFAMAFPSKVLPASNSNSHQEESKNSSAPEAFSILSKAQLGQIKIEIGSAQGISHVYKRALAHVVDTPAALGGVTQVCTKAEKYLLTCLSKLELRDAFAVPKLGGFLLCGPHGSGKTVVARSIVHRLSQNRETLAHCVEINCAEFAEDRIPVLMTKFQQWFDTAAFHSPSILFLEDLDRLIPAEVEHADSFRSRQIAEVFLQIATRMCRRFERIAIVATAQQQVSVHPSLITSHLLSEIVRLTPPGKTERKDMLQCLMETGPAILQRSLPQIDLVSVASKTEGYLAADLKAFLERTVHEGAVRNIAAQVEAHKAKATSTEASESKASLPNGISKTGGESSSEDDFTLTQADFLKAQEGFVPSSLRGVAEDVDLMDCARRTEGLTGADLQAVLYNAHLEAIRVAIERDEAVKKERSTSNGGTGSSSPALGGSANGGSGEGKMMRFVSLGGRGLQGADKTSQKANLTLAERGHISQRLGLIAKGIGSAREAASGAGGESANGAGAKDKKDAAGSRPVITAEHLEVSLNNTRSSITPEESKRLDLIYKEFLGDRTGEMSNGTGSHELGQRTTLA